MTLNKLDYKNILFGNVLKWESINEAKDKVIELIKNQLKSDCKPIEAHHIGKRTTIA